MKTTIKIYLAFLLFLLPLSSFSQCTDPLVISEGGTGTDVANSSAPGPNGSVYLAGTFSGSVNFGNSIVATSTGNTEMFLAKYDSLGVIEWVRTSSTTGTGNYSTAQKTITDAAGNVYVCGTYRGTFQLGSITKNTLNLLAVPAYIAKYNSSGVLLWVRAIQRDIAVTTNLDNCEITFNVNGNIVLISSATDSIMPEGGSTMLAAQGYHNLFMVTYRPNGTFVQQHLYGPQNANAYVTEVKQASNGLVMGGYFSDSLDLGPSVATMVTPLISGPRTDGFVTWIDTTGHSSWAAHVTGTINSRQVNGIAYDSADNAIYLAGEMTGDVRIGSARINFATTGAFIARLTGNTGVADWLDTISHAVYNDIEVNSTTGEVFAAGRARNSVYFNNAQTPGTQNALLVARYSRTGDEEAIITVNAFDNATEQANEIHLYGNDLYIAGYITDTVLLDGIPGAHVGANDALLWKTCQTLIPATPAPPTPPGPCPNAVVISEGGNGVRYDYATSVAAGINGTLYMGGAYNDTVNFGGTSQQHTLAVDQFNLFLAQYDAAGNLNWVRTAQNNQGPTDYIILNSILPDNSGNVYISGFFRDTLRLGAMIRTGDNFQNTFIAKYDFNGNLLWLRFIGGNHITDTPLAFDAAGNVTLVSTVSGPDPITAEGAGTPMNFTNNGWCMATVTYRTDGTFVRQKLFDDSPDSHVAVLMAKQAGAYLIVAGEFERTLDFGGNTSALVADSTDGFVAGLDSLGNCRWINTVTGVRIQGCSGVAYDSTDNSVYAVGAYDFTVNFSGQPVGPLTQPGYGAWLAKYNAATGAFIWKDTVCNVSYNAVAVSSASAGVFVTGNSFGNVYWDTVINTGSQPALLLGRYSRTGTKEAVRIEGEYDSSEEKGLDIAVKNDAVYVAGYITDTITIDGIPAPFKGGITDALLWKTCQSLIPALPAAPTVLAANLGPDTSVCAGTCITLSCNPAAPNYLWSNGATTPTVTLCAVADTTIVLAVFDTAGNTDLDTINVLVSFCDTVWPGDADNDGVADVYDVLQVGQSFGATGYVRPNANATWTGQPCPRWTGATGAVDMYADCDGDGTVDFPDFNVVSPNYGLTHNKGNEPLPRLPGNPILYLMSQQANAVAGDTIHYDVMLGSSSLPVSSLYGIAMNLNYTSWLVVPGSITVDYNNSFLSTQPNDIRTLDKDIAVQNRLDIGMTRVNHQNIAGYGRLATINFILIDDIAGKDSIRETFKVTVTGVKAVEEGLIEVLVDQVADTVIVSQEVGIGEIAQLNMQIYPNPASSYVTVVLDKVYSNVTLTLLNALGQEVKHQNNSATKTLRCSVEDLTAGTYFIRVEADGALNYQKLLVSP